MFGKYISSKKQCAHLNQIDKFLSASNKKIINFNFVTLLILTFRPIINATFKLTSLCNEFFSLTK